MNVAAFISLGILGALGLSPENGPDHAIDFDSQIMPVLTRCGCNSGSCHGSAAGRGNFKLSLYGSRPDDDYDAIARQFQSRRVQPADPENSLVLLKPTEQLEHGGGERIALGDPAYKLLVQWIGQGALRGDSRRLLTLHIDPPAVVVSRPGESFEIQAEAHFEGEPASEDVTAWTVFQPDDPTAWSVGAQGNVFTPTRAGRHLLVARFLDRVVSVEVLVPIGPSAVDLSAAQQNNWIDPYVYKRLEPLRLPAAPPCDDSTLARRLYLDLSGRLPTADQVRSFVADPNPDKREKLIDRLIESTDFTDYWTYRLGLLLRVGSSGQDALAAETYYRWLHDQIAHRTGLDQLARQLLLSLGDTHQVGPANYYRTGATARDLAEHTSQLFMASRLKCANCHDHPLDRWTQDDYHGLAAIFSTIQRGQVIRQSARGEVIHPATGQPATPRIPGERMLDSQEDHRAQLANWLTSGEHPVLARAMVNRVWGQLMGRGLVEPVDDLRATNPPTHPELYERLVEHFVASNYDLRQLMRVICQSSAYQRAGRAAGNLDPDNVFYSYAAARPLDAEVLIDAISDVTGVPERYPGHAEGTRAIDLCRPQVISDTLDVLGRCSRDVSCEGDVRSAPGLSLQLQLVNGGMINDKIVSDHGRLAEMVRSGLAADQIVVEFYWRCLSRQPTAEEQAFWLAQIADAGGTQSKIVLLQDIVWSLLVSRQFSTNH